MCNSASVSCWAASCFDASCCAASCVSCYAVWPHAASCCSRFGREHDSLRRSSLHNALCMAYTEGLHICLFLFLILQLPFRLGVSNQLLGDLQELVFCSETDRMYILKLIMSWTCATKASHLQRSSLVALQTFWWNPLFIIYSH